MNVVLSMKLGSYDRTKVWATEWDGMSDERRPVYFPWEIPGDKILNIYPSGLVV